MSEKVVKEIIRTAWREGDVLSLIRAGIESFMSVLYRSGSAPISFQRFLDHTGLLLDRYVSDTSRQEHMNYVGGRMVLQLDRGKHRAVGTIPIRLSADLYFQTADKQWIVKQKQGHVDSTRFTDWDTDETAVALQQIGTLEWSVEPSTT